MRLDVADAVLGEQGSFVVARVDDDHPALVELEVAFDQRQGAAADGAEADHHDRARDFCMNRIVLLAHSTLLQMRSPPRGPCRTSLQWPFRFSERSRS